MPKCPECNSEIDHLYLNVQEHKGFDVFVVQGKVIYESIDDIDEDPIEEFICPECRETIAETEEEAEDILKSDLKENITE